MPRIKFIPAIIVAQYIFITIATSLPLFHDHSNHLHGLEISQTQVESHHEAHHDGEQHECLLCNWQNLVKAQMTAPYIDYNGNYAQQKHDFIAILYQAILFSQSASRAPPSI